MFTAHIYKHGEWGGIFIAQIESSGECFPRNQTEPTTPSWNHNIHVPISLTGASFIAPICVFSNFGHDSIAEDIVYLTLEMQPWKGLFCTHAQLSEWRREWLLPSVEQQSIPPALHIPRLFQATRFCSLHEYMNEPTKHVCPRAPGRWQEHCTWERKAPSRHKFMMSPRRVYATSLNTSISSSHLTWKQNKVINLLAALQLFIVISSLRQMSWDTHGPCIVNTWTWQNGGSADTRN